jgi:hypothetical protein
MYLSVCLPGKGGIGLRVDYRFDMALHPAGRAVGYFPKERGGEVPSLTGSAQRAPIWLAVWLRRTCRCRMPTAMAIGRPAVWALKGTWFLRVGATTMKGCIRPRSTRHQAPSLSWWVGRPTSSWSHDGISDQRAGRGNEHRLQEPPIVTELAILVAIDRGHQPQEVYCVQQPLPEYARRSPSQASEFAPLKSASARANLARARRARQRMVGRTAGLSPLTPCRAAALWSKLLSCAPWS